MSYFQGPRFHVALVLEIAGPDEEEFRVFSTEEFLPPANLDSLAEPLRQQLPVANQRP